MSVEKHPEETDVWATYGNCLIAGCHLCKCAISFHHVVVSRRRMACNQHPDQPFTQDFLVEEIDWRFEGVEIQPHPICNKKRVERSRFKLGDIKRKEKLGISPRAKVAGDWHQDHRTIQCIVAETGRQVRELGARFWLWFLIEAAPDDSQHDQSTDTDADGNMKVECHPVFLGPLIGEPLSIID